MRISVNNKQMYFDNTLSVKELITKLNLEMKNIAIEINETIVPRSKYEQFCINDKDKVEIIVAVGGG